MKKFLIYALYHSLSDHIYVGRSSSGMRRPISHGHDRFRDQYPVHRWITALRRRGLEFEIAVLQEYDDALQLNDDERFYITYFRSLGLSLLNCTDGGEGALNPIPSTREKMAKAKRGKSLPSRHRQHIAESLRGRVFSIEWKKKISEAKRQNSPSEHIIALNKSRIGKPLSMQHRKSLSVANRASERCLMQRQRDLGKQGENHPRAKLTTEQVCFIRQSNIPVRLLAQQFSVSRSTIYAVRSGQNWHA